MSVMFAAQKYLVLAAEKLVLVLLVLAPGGVPISQIAVETIQTPHTALQPTMTQHRQEQHQ